MCRHKNLKFGKNKGIEFQFNLISFNLNPNLLNKM